MFAFKKITISEYQKITPDPFTIYNVIKEPGVYDADTGNIRANWEELITPVPDQRGAIFEIDENGVLYLGSEAMAQNAWTLLSNNGILILPEGIIDINYPFTYSGLKGIILPDSLEILPQEFLAQSGRIDTFIVGNNLTTIPMSTCYMTPVKYILFGDNVEEIGSYAFSYCEISSVVLPNKLKNIGLEAFDGCPNLKSITIPASVISINAAAFSRNPIYEDGKLVSEGLEEYIFENTSGWYLCEDAKGTTVVEPLNISNDGRKNARELPSHSMYYFVRK